MGRPQPAADSPAEINNDSAGTRLPNPGVFEELSHAFTSARATLANLLELLSLEARRAGIAVMWLAASGIIAGICLVSAWLGLLAALTIWLASLGLPLLAAIVAVIVLNLLMAAVLIYLCIDKSRDLLFSATRRQLAGTDPVAPPSR